MRSIVENPALFFLSILSGAIFGIVVTTIEMHESKEIALIDQKYQLEQQCLRERHMDINDCAKAMQGHMASEYGVGVQGDCRYMYSLAEACYSMADAMLKARVSSQPTIEP